MELYVFLQMGIVIVMIRSTRNFAKHNYISTQYFFSVFHFSFCCIHNSSYRRALIIEFVCMCMCV